MMSHQGARGFALREVILLGLIVAMGVMVGTDAGKFEIELSSMKVMSPSSLVGDFDASIGDFGVPLYGAQLTGSLLWVPDHPGACSAFPLPLHKVAPDNGQEGLPIIALVERGHGCYFVEKVWYAQEAGAQAVLIMDNRDEDLLTMAVPADAVASSDFSHRLDIPAALIKQEVGQRLKAALTSGDHVVVQLDWTESMLHPDDRVEWEFWHSSSPACGRACETARDFIAGFQETAEQLDKDGDTQFQPHFMFQKCSRSRRLSGECSREKCIRGGRYCPVEGVASEYRAGLQLHQVMVENLRQLCIWRYWNDQDQGWLWWEYAARFGKSCHPSTRPSSATSSTGFTDTCAESVMHDLGIPVHTVNECMGEVDEDEDHDLLEAELSLMADNEASGRGLVMLMPTVVINTNQYRGRLDSLSILKAICAGFAEGTEPQVCLSSSIQEEDCLSAASDQCWRGDGKSACIDTFRGFVCLCPSGYSGDGKQCELVDQCSVNNGGCEEACMSGRGGEPVCTCGPGLRLAADGKHCEDVHECSQPTTPCAQICTEEDPRVSNGGAAYECSCRPGYAINPANASDCITQQALRTALIGDDTSGGSSSSSIGEFAALVVLCTVTVVAVVYGVYRWKIRGSMSKEMRMIMKEYIPVEGAASGLGERLMEPASSPAQYTANTHAPTTSNDLV